MPTLLQINITANWGSTGRIAEGIGLSAMKEGWRSIIAYGRQVCPSQSELIRIGTRWDVSAHWLGTRLFDRHGLMSARATRSFIRQLQDIKPDIIHLHNIHGYYLNYPILFNYLHQTKIPIIWTLHDCWPFTGHCSYFDACGCQQWQQSCTHCPQRHSYPGSILISRSQQNHALKQQCFLNLPNLTLVPVSKWLEKLIEKSFLREVSTYCIHNGINLSKFSPTNTPPNSVSGTYVLGIASTWDDRKGLSDFLQLRQLLPPHIDIVLVGINQKQAKKLPSGIITVKRTENLEELKVLYSAALALANPTHEDNFPTTNLEALACGTPVITYQTGGSPEAVDDTTGLVVPKGDICAMADAIITVYSRGKDCYTHVCRERAEKYFNEKECFGKYIRLYQGKTKS